MSTLEEAVRGLIGTEMNWGPIHICQRLYEGFPIILVFCDVVKKASEYSLVVSIGLATGLRMVRRSMEVFTTRQGV